MKAWTTLFVFATFATAVAMADDADDVKAAVRSYYTAINANNVDAWRQHLQPGYTAFNSDGGLLVRDDSLIGAGVSRTKRNLQPRHIDVSIYGNLTAVATHYVVGTRTLPDGTVEQRNSRRTVVLIKQGGQWKQVHRHQSPLTISTPRIEDRFVGTWKFVSIEQRNAKGEVLPVISDRTGFIIYTPTGHMAVQLMEDERKEFAAAQPSGEEAQAALASFTAYSGTFTVNEAQGTVTHHRETRLTPGMVDALGGTDVTRSYRFSGNRLMLTPPPRMIDGEELTRTLTWERME